MTVLTGFNEDVAATVRQLHGSGEFEAALDVLKRHPPTDDEGRVVHEMLTGRTASLMGRYHEARDHLVTSLWISRKLQRSRVQIRAALCSLLLNSGDTIRAQRELRRALTEIRLKQHDLEIEPNLLSFLGGIYRRRGMLGMAIRVHEEALALARMRGVSRWGAIAVNLANALFTHGDVDRAGRLLEDLLNRPEVFLPSHYIYVRVLLAVVALENNDFDRVDRVLAPIESQIDRLEASNQATYLLCKADTLTSRGRPQEALALVQSLWERTESERALALLATGVLVCMAAALYDLGRYDDALREAQKAVLRGRASDPVDWARAMKIAAKCLARLGRMEAARTTIAEAHAILRTSDCMLDLRGLRETAESLGIDIPVIDGRARPALDEGLKLDNVPQWLALRDGRSFLTTDPNLALRIQRSAAQEIPVLIEGESGTGKELVSHLIHELGPRPDGPFVVVDCTTLSPELAEAELFGAARGAYTGSVGERQGLVEVAKGGTLFLDEITEMTLPLQAKLLRLLQEGTYRRVGEPRERKTNLRIVAASNRDVERMVREGKMRLDLFYRLKGHRLRLASLRERPRERRLLADEFARAAGLLGVSTEAHRFLDAYSWPGNVRELQLLIRAASAGVPAGGWLDASDLEATAPELAHSTNGETFRGTRTEAERDTLTRALVLNGGNVTAAAKSLGLSRQGLYKAMRRAGVTKDGDLRVNWR